MGAGIMCEFKALFQLRKINGIGKANWGSDGSAGQITNYSLPHHKTKSFGQGDIPNAVCCLNALKCQFIKLQECHLSLIAIKCGLDKLNWIKLHNML